MRPLARLIDLQTQQAEQLDRPEIASLCVTQQEVNTVLLRIAESLQPTAPQAFELTKQERDQQAQLRSVANDATSLLPLDSIQTSLRLTEPEINTLIGCAAVEVDRSFEKLIAYVHDDLNCRFPSVEFLSRLVSPDPLDVRSLLGPLGKLRTSGLLTPFGEQTLGGRTPLRLGKGVLEYLLGDSPSVAGIWMPASVESRWQSYEPTAKLASMIRSGEIEVVGLWGSDARSVAINCFNDWIEIDLGNRSSLAEAVDDALHQASLRQAVVVLDTDRLLSLGAASDAEDAISCIARCSVPCIFYGKTPWRPTSLLAKRSYMELPITEQDRDAQTSLWHESFPEMQAADAKGMAARYGLSRDEIAAAGKLAKTSARYHSNGQPISWRSQLDQACLTVAAKQSGKFVAQVAKKRGPDDLVLPPDLHQQILEIATFASALPAVAEDWGFGRIASGELGIKCLFAGDPGTGKTLAAEVIASVVAAPLLRVNLAQTVSKWVGETEKNVDSAFEEAAASRSILFFDEADALFGKRGEVKQGTDRYANLEVSHLLQRLEDHAGVVILATNLKDNIDPAFLRRFQSVLHFPRPTETERKRIWEIAFPVQAPVTQSFSPEMFARLDLTGAGIVNAARTAALLAASQHSAEIQIPHIVSGITRQFRQDGRIVSPRDFGEHAHLMMEL